MDNSDSQWRRARWVLPTVVILSTFYLNIAGILQSARLHIDLPRPRQAREFYRMFGLFAHYSKWNFAFEAEGRVATADQSRWISLDLYEYFPAGQGAANRRLKLPSRTATEKTADFRRIMQVIKQRYNNTHPAEPIDRVRIQSVYWPKSIQGYMHRHNERKRRSILAEG